MSDILPKAKELVERHKAMRDGQARINGLLARAELPSVITLVQGYLDRVIELENERAWLLDCIKSWGGECEDIAWDLENYPRGDEAKQDVAGAKVVAKNMNYSMLELVRRRRAEVPK